MDLPCIDVIIKFGGSAITDKNSLETLRSQQLALASRCVRECRDAGLTCVVVHGAGSFGHHQAKKYSINSGYQTDVQEQLMGYSLTRKSVQELNTHVTNSLLKNGVPAVKCSPGCSWMTDNREPVSWPRTVLKELLELGLVPVLHGDVCCDRSMGFCILSGDTVIKTLCSSFMVKRVVFLTDVQGVYDRPPQEAGSQLLKTISIDASGTVKDVITTSQSQHDVTGGIQLKLKTATDILVASKGACPVYIASVESPSVRLVCMGKDEREDLDLTKIFMVDSCNNNNNAQTIKDV